MSVYFCSDLHLGHKNISNFRAFISSCEDNTEFIIKDWEKRINKNDIVYILGDAAFDKKSLDILSYLKGRKILIKGNHDDFVSTKEQEQVFEEIHGIIKYKGLWLTHCPIHPDEMRNRVGNIHGHVHQKSVTNKTWYGKKVIDKKYLNACIDVIWPKYNSIFISLDEVKKYFNF